MTTSCPRPDSRCGAGSKSRMTSEVRLLAIIARVRRFGTRTKADWRNGGGGIRTHGWLAPSTVFKTVPIDHSGTPPLAHSLLADLVDDIIGDVNGDVHRDGQG